MKKIILLSLTLGLFTTTVNAVWPIAKGTVAGIAVGSLGSLGLSWAASQIPNYKARLATAFLGGVLFMVASNEGAAYALQITDKKDKNEQKIFNIVFTYATLAGSLMPSVISTCKSVISTNEIDYRSHNSAITLGSCLGEAIYRWSTIADDRKATPTT